MGNFAKALWRNQNMEPAGDAMTEIGDYLTQQRQKRQINELVATARKDMANTQFQPSTETGYGDASLLDQDANPLANQDAGGAEVGLNVRGVPRGTPLIPQEGMTDEMLGDWNNPQQEHKQAQGIQNDVLGKVLGIVGNTDPGIVDQLLGRMTAEKKADATTKASQESRYSDTVERDQYGKVVSRKEGQDKPMRAKKVHSYTDENNFKITEMDDGTFYKSGSKVKGKETKVKKIDSYYDDKGYEKYVWQGTDGKTFETRSEEKVRPPTNAYANRPIDHKANKLAPEYDDIAENTRKVETLKSATFEEGSWTNLWNDKYYLDGTVVKTKKDQKVVTKAQFERYRDNKIKEGITLAEKGLSGMFFKMKDEGGNSFEYTLNDAAEQIDKGMDKHGDVDKAIKEFEEDNGVTLGTNDRKALGQYYKAKSYGK